MTKDQGAQLIHGSTDVNAKQNQHWVWTTKKDKGINNGRTRSGQSLLQTSHNILHQVTQFRRYKIVTKVSHNPDNRDSKELDIEIQMMIIHLCNNSVPIDVESCQPIPLKLEKLKRRGVEYVTEPIQLD